MRSTITSITFRMDWGAERKNISHIGLVLFVMIVATMAFRIAGGILVPKLFSDGGNAAYFAMLMLPNYLIVMPLAAYALKRSPSERIVPKSLGPGQLMIIFMICYFIIYTGNIIGIIVTTIIGLIANSNMMNPVSNMLEASNIWLNITVFVIAAPVIEECFFRKLLIERLNRYGERVAIIVSGLIFGLVHGNFSQFFYAFGLGLAFGYIFVKTGKLRYTIAMHIIINFMGSVLVPLIGRNVYISALFGMMIIGVVIAGLVLFILNKKRISFREGEHTLDKWKSTVFLSPGMIAFFGACAVLFAVNTYFALA